MYCIEVRYYEGKNFTDEWSEDLCVITVDDDIEDDPFEEDVLWFRTVEEAKDYFDTNWTATDIEENVQGLDGVQSVRYVIRNNEDSSYNKVIAQATYLFRLERF